MGRYKTIKTEGGEIIPPNSEKIGEYWVELPKPPPLNTISGYNIPKKDQKFTRIPFYTERGLSWDELCEEEELFQSPFLDTKGNPTFEVTTRRNKNFIAVDYVNPKCEDFRVQEWDRRINGFWFMNNGVATFITGLHYFYLTYWKIDIGYPKYRACDRRRALLWDKACKDPKSYGMADIARRRQGKSWWSACIAFEDASRFPNHNSGMQSKEEKAAKKWFSEKIMKPWKDMVNFFKPISSTGTDARDALEFKAEKKKGKSAKGRQEEELRSMITCGPSTTTFYDGQKLHIYISDEWGKCVESNIIDRHYIVRQCCRQEQNIIGKMYCCTTVEEMSKGGGANAKVFWDTSAPEKNKTGLYRLFQPAYEGYLIDEYGNDLIEESKKKIEEEEFAPFMDDPRKYAQQRRFFPFDVSDCFGGDTSKCIFDPVKLLNRDIFLKSLTNPRYTVGNFSWENGERDTSVKFTSNPAGRFKITFHPEEPNKVLRDGQGKPIRPQNKDKYVIGDDPIEYEFVEGDTMSNAASHCFRKFDILLDGHERDISKWQTNRFVMEYVCRPTPKVFYEDMIMACVYFGCEFHGERQKLMGLRTYFYDRGYKAFLMSRPESTFSGRNTKDKMEGTPNSAPMLNQIADAIDSYISEDIFGDDQLKDGYEHGYCCLVDFPNIITSWMEFDITNTRKYDETISTGYALIGATKFIKPKQKRLNFGKYFVSYNQMGDRSVPNEEDFREDVDEDSEKEEKPEITAERMKEIMNDPYLIREYGFIR